MKLVFNHVFFLVSVFALSFFVEAEDTCGIPKINTGLIVHGQSFSRGNFPWIVALMYTKVQPPIFFCAGTIISPTFVTSAAHCINQKHSQETFLPRDVFAFFGAHNLSNLYESGRFSRSPKKITLHDDWNPMTTQYDGDISLLEFERESIHFNEFVQPICIWDSDVDPPEIEGVVPGWGQSEDTSKKHETEPKLVKVLIQTNEICLPGENTLAGISSTRTFCAGLKNGSGVCRGDSGGGLFVKVDGVYYLKGIVSSSQLKNDACDVSKNAVYTNAVKFLDWINRITGRSSSNRVAAAVERTTSAPKQRIPSQSPNIQDATKIFCKFKSKEILGNKENACQLTRNIDHENYVIGNEANITVKGFDISNNRGAKYLPSEIGKKFANLIDFRASSCELIFLSKSYFENMQELKFLYLDDNKIEFIEPNSFKDLVKVKHLQLERNLIETLDEKLFQSMVELSRIWLDYNRIKFLSPRTFNIPGESLDLVQLRSNVCINDWYGTYKNIKSLDQLAADIRTNCKL